MKSLAPLAFATLLLGCPSKDSSSSSGATSPSTSGSPAASSSATPAGTGTGPLANLESQPSVAEPWTSSDGKPLPMLYYTAQNVRISASCKQASGQLDCDAIRQLRTAVPVEVAGGGRPGTSMGTKGCKKLGYQLVTGRNSVGAEDGFCTFPDGSMLSTGALEQYGMKILER